MKPKEKLELCDNDKIISRNVESKNETESKLVSICHGDLYVIGKLWIDAMTTVMLGPKKACVPVVKAANVTQVPEKPKATKFRDLPLYDTSHFEYTDHLEEKHKCCEHNDKILHNYLLPYMHEYRLAVVNKFSEAKCTVDCCIDDVKNSVCKAEKDIKSRMRDPENLNMRRGVVVSSGLLGYLLACKRGIPSRIFMGNLGLLAAGSLCFPKETDENFRFVVFNAAKFILSLYNSTCRKSYSLREGIPCQKDYEPPAPLKTKVTCPAK